MPLPHRLGASGSWPASLLAVLDHAWHGDNPRVDRGNSAITVLSRPTTGLSALAPAQRAGAQRLCALALLGRGGLGARRPLLREEQTLLLAWGKTL